MDTLKVVSWNIAGGRKTKSDVRFDYDAEDLSYFSSEIKKFDPDVVCLQENVRNHVRSVAEEMAEQLAMENVFDISARHVANHIDADYELGMAILSKHKFDGLIKEIFYPDPSFDLYWKDGTRAVMHHKFLQVVQIGGIHFANTQMLPIHLWGYSYNVGPGVAYAKGIEEVLIDELSSPLIFCGDFNVNEPKQIYPSFFEKLDLENSLPVAPTRPANNKQDKPDHIFYSSEFKVIRSEVVQTQSDHYLCFAELRKV